MPVLIGTWTSKQIQDSKTASLQSTISKLTAATKQLREVKGLPGSLWLPAILRLQTRRASQLGLRPLLCCHLPTSRQRHPQPLHTLSLPQSNLLSMALAVRTSAPLSSSEPIRTRPFKVKPSQDPTAELRASYVPWTKAELQATVQNVPKVTEDPSRFVEEFNVVIQTYRLGFSDLY